MTDRITIPKPTVPYGPEGVPPDIATADYLRELVRKIDGRYCEVGGSNVTATVRRLLLDVADALTTQAAQCASQSASGNQSSATAGTPCDASGTRAGKACGKTAVAARREPDGGVMAVCATHALNGRMVPLRTLLEDCDYCGGDAS